MPATRGLCPSFDQLGQNESENPELLLAAHGSALPVEPQGSDATCLQQGPMLLSGAVIGMYPSRRPFSAPLNYDSLVKTRFEEAPAS